MSRNKHTIDADNPQYITTTGDDILEEIAAAGGAEQNNIKSRVYRIVETGGKTRQEYCGVFEKVVNENDVAENFGGGDYSVKYSWRNSEGRQETTRVYNISKDIFKPIDKSSEEGPAGTVAGTPAAPAPVPAAAPAGGMLGGLLGNLTAEKVTAGLALLDAVKKFLAPPPPPDYTPLFKMMLETNRGQTVGDAVVIEALKQANKPAAPAPTVMEQINNLKAVRDAFAGDFAGGENSNRGSEMSYFIDKALEILPDMLAKHQNNYRAVGAEAAKNSMVQALIKNDPALTQEFFNAAVQTYGPAAAKQLADGFGIALNIEEPPAEPAPQLAQQQQEPAPAAAN
ncbi:MAG: hypothetical protein IIU66_04990 [Clostridia bacterium]|nr:hypothetical protein [Clostridia bacterium]